MGDGVHASTVEAGATSLGGPHDRDTLHNEKLDVFECESDVEFVPIPHSGHCPWVW